MKLLRFFRQFKNLRQKHKRYMPLSMMLKIAWRRSDKTELNYKNIERIELKDVLDFHYSKLSDEDKNFIEKTEGCIDLGYPADEEDLKVIKKDIL